MFGRIGNALCWRLVSEARVMRWAVDLVVQESFHRIHAEIGGPYDVYKGEWGDLIITWMAAGMHSPLMLFHLRVVFQGQTVFADGFPGVDSTFRRGRWIIALREALRHEQKRVTDAKKGQKRAAGHGDRAHA